MRRWLFVLLIVTLLVVPALAASAAPPSAPFVGAWEALDGDEDGDGDVDDGDGSYMRLTISNGPRGVYRFNYKDWGASVCGKDAEDEPLYAATVIGRAELTDENELEGEGPLVCLAKPRAVHPDSPLQMSFVYDPATDTIWDGWVTWQRMSVLPIHP